MSVSAATIPAGWVEVSFEDAVIPVSDRGLRIKQKEYLLEGPVAVVDQGEGLIGGYTDAASAKVDHPAPLIVFGDHTRRFKYVDFPFAVGADGVKLFAATELWEPHFLFYQLETVDLEDRGYGRHYQQLRKTALIAPPKSEQTRIVEKLEELLSDLDAGVAELKAAQRKLVRYRQSLLRAAVEGVMDGMSAGYPKRPLVELVRSINQGWSPRCDQESSNDDQIWAVIKTTAIQSLHFDGAHNKKLPLNLQPRKHLELKKGDLLVTRAGPRSRVGITCLVRNIKKRLILCDKAYRINCDESIIDPEFLELVLNAPHVVNQIDSLKTGINDSGLNLTQDRFFTLMIPTPSIDEQRRSIESIKTQMASIEEQGLVVEHALKQAAAQRKNLLKAAFAGQLVPQDPNDEPASELLARIRAEREQSPVTRARRRAGANPAPATKSPAAAKRGRKPRLHA